MIEELINDAISALFEMPCVEYSGQKRNGGTIYLSYDNEIDVVTNPNINQIITADCTISVLCVSGRTGIGFLSGKLFDFGSKGDQVTIEALGQKEQRVWISENSFIMSKEVKITTKVDFNVVREKIENISISEIKQYEESPPIASRFIYNLDGIDDFIKIPDVDLRSGDVIEFDFIAPESYAGHHRSFIYGSGIAMYINNIDGRLRLSGVEAKMDGVTLKNGEVMLGDKARHNIQLLITRDSKLKTIGSNSNYWSANFPIFNVKIKTINDSRFYKLDENDNSIAVDSYGGRDGTFENFNDDRWVIIDE